MDIIHVFISKWHVLQLIRAMNSFQNRLCWITHFYSLLWEHWMIRIILCGVIVAVVTYFLHFFCFVLFCSFWNCYRAYCLLMWCCKKGRVISTVSTDWVHTYSISMRKFKWNSRTTVVDDILTTCQRNCMKYIWDT